MSPLIAPAEGGPESVSPLTRRFSTVGLLVGTLFFAVSLTPSLLPRAVMFQGLVSGLSLTLGYALGRLGSWLWTYLELPAPRARVGRIVTLVVAAICAIVAAAFLARATDWQNSVRAIMGMEEVSNVRQLDIVHHLAVSGKAGPRIRVLRADG